MRDIKFRAWHKKRKKFYKVLHLHIDNITSGGEWATCEGFSVIEQKEIHIQVQPEDCLVEQFTGLHDKNGKEIYEGDVCLDEKLGIYADVYFDAGSFWFGAVLLCTEDRFVVSGNIHENPELLNN